jgi:hypothetical protein
MPFELADAPLDSQCVEHRQKGADIGGAGIEQRAIPIKQHRSRFKTRETHGRGMVPDRYKTPQVQTMMNVPKNTKRC